MKRKKYSLEYVSHFFGQSETIDAVIKSKNKNEGLKGPLFEQLVTAFNVANNFEVPTMGKEYKIPILKEQ